MAETSEVLEGTGDIKEEQDVFRDDKVEKLELSEEGSEDEQPYTDGLLSENEVYELSSRQKTEIIYVLGGVKSGKTTFETVLYGIFHNEIDDEWWFAGSDTIPAFEVRRQAVSIKGKSDEPIIHMPRTWQSNGHQVFLHMNLFHVTTGKRKHVLFSDVSGEDYEVCRSNADELEKRLPLIRLASHILIFLDSERLLKEETRESTVMSAVSFLRTLGNRFPESRGTVVDIVVSKADLINREGNGESNQDYIYNIKNRFKASEKDFEMQYHWIEAKNIKELENPAHSTDTKTFLKYVLDEEKVGLRDIDRKRIEQGFRDEQNLLRRRWSNE